MSNGKHRIVVLGGGFAGLQVARELNESFEVIVLEARDRVGGRVETTTLATDNKKVKLELGAGWIQGVHKNPVAELACEADKELIKWDFEKRLSVRLNDKGVIGWKSKWTAAIDELLETRFLEKYVALRPCSSLADAINEARKNKKSAISKLDQYELDAVLYSEISLEMAADPSSIAASSMLLDDILSGGDAMLKDGLSELSAFLAKGIDVRLNHPVTKIENNSKVYVGDDLVFEADAIVCTVPLGILKSEAIHFEPPLPNWKLEAIHALDMGLLNRVYLVFPSLWWGDKKLDQLLCVDSSEFTNYFNLFGRVLDGEPVLCALLGGSRAEAMEPLSDEDTVAEVMRVLRRSFGPKKYIPEPSSYLVTRWGQDPWTYGSYSFVKAGAQPEARAVLAQPCDNLFFAGEAAAFDYPSTMHGALLSGKRAAADIKQYFELPEATATNPMLL